MGGEKHGPKSGRYVGGFLQLFDWNAKSRKKLFPNKSDLPEQPKQGKKSEGNLPVTWMRVAEDEEYGAEIYTRGASEYSYASSMTDDDVYRTKPPGVVGRLMGLDSLPTYNVADQYPDPFYNTRSFQDAPFRTRTPDFYQDHQLMHSTHPSEIGTISRPPKMRNNWPIEKFQSEILPPKSAKTIPITHHKLLSPIKRPIFVPSQDAAQIMEAASKIIEPGPQVPPGAKISSSRSSPVPFKVREMSQKLEATQRPMHRQVESNGGKCLRGQPMNKSWNGTVESDSLKVSSGRIDDDSSSKSKGKSVSLAIQAKFNVQKRVGLASSSRNFTAEEKNQTSRKSSNSSVLRVNNQKQNCPLNRDKPMSKTSTGKKSVVEDSSNNRKTNSRKSRENDKGNPYSGARNVPRKKRSIGVSKNELDKGNQSNMIGDRNLNWIEESRRKGMDVVSFTFSAPMTRSLRVSHVFSDDRNKTLTSPGFNGLKGDALSILLEQKLKELSSSLGSPDSFAKTGSGLESANRSLFSPDSVESVIGNAREKAAKLVTNEPKSVRRVFNFQAGEAMEEDYSNIPETKQWNTHLPSPISTLEPSMFTESCYSSETLATYSTEERKQCSFVLAQGVADMDTSDSASSTQYQLITTKHNTKSTSWELTYVKNILCNIELMFKDYVTGRTREVVNPHLFEQMERRKGKSTEVKELKLERKVLFDCVAECVDLKCQRFVGGGFKMWTKGITSLKRPDRLAEGVFKEIQGWRSMGNSNVDELVDKDMSSQYGKWSDFEVDEFILGVEIEDHVLDSLVVELVSDLFSSKRLSTW